MSQPAGGKEAGIVSGVPTGIVGTVIRRRYRAEEISTQYGADDAVVANVGADKGSAVLADGVQDFAAQGAGAVVVVFGVPRRRPAGVCRAHKLSILEALVVALVLAE